MAGTRLPPLFLSLIFVYFGATLASHETATALLSFKATVSDPAGSLGSWTVNSDPCASPTWAGIICDDNGDVLALLLESMSLSGRLDLDPLTALPLIRILSFVNNSFTGPMPDLKRFTGLRNVFFALNRFTGEIPDDAFDGMQALRKVGLSRNWFSGRIPSSLARLNTLLEVWLDSNGFSGEIPSSWAAGLLLLNVSHNNLEGRIPDDISNMDPSVFAGNSHLCGPPTTVPCESPSPSASPLPSSMPPLPSTMPPMPPMPSSMPPSTSETFSAAKKFFKKI